MNILEFIHKFSSELSGKKIAFSMAFMVVVIVCVISYEIQTSHFQLEKLTQSTLLLKELEPLTQSNSSDVKALAVEIIHESSKILKQGAQENIEITERGHRLLLSIILGVPWVVLSLLGVIEAFKKDPDWHYSVMGCLFIGSLLAGVGYSVPVNMHWFFRYLLMPLAITGLLLYIFWIIDDEDESNEVT